MLPRLTCYEFRLIGLIGFKPMCPTFLASNVCYSKLSSVLKKGSVERWCHFWTAPICYRHKELQSQCFAMTWAAWEICITFFFENWFYVHSFFKNYTFSALNICTRFICNILQYGSPNIWSGINVQLGGSVRWLQRNSLMSQLAVGSPKLGWDPWAPEDQQESS